jgi:hypothetical protein
VTRFGFTSTKVRSRRDRDHGVAFAAERRDGVFGELVNVEGPLEREFKGEGHEGLRQKEFTELVDPG